MIDYLLNNVDWFQVLFNSPICVSGFGIGLCVRGLIVDCFLTV